MPGDEARWRGCDEAALAAREDGRTRQDRSDMMTGWRTETMDGRPSQDRSVPDTGIVPVLVLYILTRMAMTHPRIKDVTDTWRIPRE